MSVITQKSHLKFFCTLSGIFLLLYAGYITINESRTTHLAASDTRHYGELLSGYLWDIDEETAQEYTALITVEGNFKSLEIRHDNGAPFTSYHHEKYYGEIRSFFKSINLIRDIKNESPILYKGKHIGNITSVRENTNIYTYFYLLLLILLCVVLLTLVRIGKANKTQRKHLELDLNENKERLQTVVSASPVITFSLDKHGVFSFCEGMGLNKLQGRPRDIIGKSIENVQHFIPASRNDFLRALRGETFSEIRVTNDRSFETWYSPVYEEEAISGVTGVSTDVTAAIQAINSLDEFKRRTKQELTLAQRSHTALTPNSPPSLENYEVGFLSKHAESIGGDYLHFSHSNDNKSLGIAFAEMSGHGVSSSLLASIFHSQLEKHLSHQTPSISEAFYDLNEEIYELFPEGRFASTFYTIIDSVTNKMRYVKASKEPAVLYRSGQPPQVMDKGGPALGLLPSELLNKKSYKEDSLTLEVNDTLLLYSDGIVEVENAAGNLLERKDIIQWVEKEIHLSPQELAHSIHRKVISHSAGNELADDISILVIRRSK